LNDRAYIRQPRREAEASGGHRSIGEQRRGISFAPLLNDDRYIATGHSLHGVKNFADRGASPGSKIGGKTRPALHKMPKGTDMGLAQIRHMHEIANTCAIGGRIIITKDLK